MNCLNCKFFLHEEIKTITNGKCTKHTSYFACKHEKAERRGIAFLGKSISPGDIPYACPLINTPILIGLCGDPGSGKDTVAKILRDKYKFMNLSFAERGKKIINEIFDLDSDQLWGNKKEIIDERYNKTPRQIMQIIIHGFRKVNEDVWINYIRKEMKNYYFNLFVISDVRMKNEFKFIKENNGIIIKVVRPDLNFTPSHITDTDIKDEKPDYIIINNKNVSDLEENVISLMESIKKECIKNV